MLEILLYSKQEDIVKVHDYETQRGTDVIKEYIESLTENERVDGLSVLENLRIIAWIY